MAEQERCPRCGAPLLDQAEEVYRQFHCPDPWHDQPAVLEQDRVEGFLGTPKAGHGQYRQPAVPSKRGDKKSCVVSDAQTVGSHPTEGAHNSSHGQAPVETAGRSSTQEDKEFGEPARPTSARVNSAEAGDGLSFPEQFWYPLALRIVRGAYANSIPQRPIIGNADEVEARQLATTIATYNVNTPTHGAAEETSAEKRKEAITAARAWRQINWYDKVPEQLDEALAAYAAFLREELAQVKVERNRLTRAARCPSCGGACSECAASECRVEELRAKLLNIAAKTAVLYRDGGVSKHYLDFVQAEAESVPKRQEGR